MRPKEKVNIGKLYSNQKNLRLANIPSIFFLIAYLDVYGLQKILFQVRKKPLKSPHTSHLKKVSIRVLYFSNKKKRRKHYECELLFNVAG